MTWVSPPLEVPDGDDEEVRRLDLQVFGVGHRDASYEVRVFVDNAEAGPATEPVAEQGYAGSYFVFGHGGCVGDAGHCHVPEGRPYAYDVRGRHKLTPQVRVLQVTEAWRRTQSRASQEGRTAETVTLTFVAVHGVGPDGEPVGDADDLLGLQRVALVAYA